MEVAALAYPEADADEHHPDDVGAIPSRATFTPPLDDGRREQKSAGNEEEDKAVDIHDIRAGRGMPCKVAACPV